MRPGVGSSDYLMVSQIDLPRLPVIDLSLFELGDPWRDQVGAQIDAALSRFGFFYIVGHGIDTAVVDSLLEAGHRFFAAEHAVTSGVQMLQQQQAPHGYLPLASTLSAGSCAIEGALDFQPQSAPEPALLRPAARGPIVLPEPPGFREPLVDYMRSLTGLGHKLMSMIARGLLLEDSYFVDRCTGNPATSLRICSYPQAAETWLAGEQYVDGAAAVDQGLLTLLKQDGAGGNVELKFEERWVEAPDLPNSFVCTVGATLARLTNGRYLPASHRVRNSTRDQHLLMPFCFGPSRDAVIEAIATIRPGAAQACVNDSVSSAQPDSARRHQA
jgi:isopenicillin N synthase-like dioxygenase